MADFLSDQWVEELKNLGSKLPKVQGASISCQYEISGTPEGKIRYYIVWKEGSVSEASKGKLDNPECRFTAKYDDIREILFGRISTEEAFMRGDLKVEGDYKKFLVDLHDWRHSPNYRKLWEDLEPS
jgi:putative sterol carrier protein